MQATIVVSERTHREALLRASAIGAREALQGGVLPGLLGDRENTWLARLWDTIQGAIQKAVTDGKAAAKDLVEKAKAQWDQIVGELGEGASNIRVLVMERLSAYVKDVIAGAVNRLEGTQKVGEQTLTLKSINIGQTIKLSASLKASIEEIVSFAAEGEISIEAQYG